MNLMLGGQVCKFDVYFVNFTYDTSLQQRRKLQQRHVILIQPLHVFNSMRSACLMQSLSESLQFYKIDIGVCLKLPLIWNPTSHSTNCMATSALVPPNATSRCGTSQLIQIIGEDHEGVSCNDDFTCIKEFTAFRASIRILIYWLIWPVKTIRGLVV